MLPNFWKSQFTVQCYQLSVAVNPDQHKCAYFFSFQSTWWMMMVTIRWLRADCSSQIFSFLLTPLLLGCIALGMLSCSHLGLLTLGVSISHQRMTQSMLCWKTDCFTECCVSNPFPQSPFLYIDMKLSQILLLNIQVSQLRNRNEEAVLQHSCLKNIKKIPIFLGRNTQTLEGQQQGKVLYCNDYLVYSVLHNTQVSKMRFQEAEG